MQQSPAAATLTIHPALREVQKGGDGYAGRFHGLYFIASATIEDDGRWWLHASVSRRDRQTPTWDDLAKLKHYTIGDDKYAYFVLPPQDRYVNIGPVLHLFHCLDGEAGQVLPEFSGIRHGVRTL